GTVVAAGTRCGGAFSKARLGGSGKQRSDDQRDRRNQDSASLCTHTRSLRNPREETAGFGFVFKVRRGTPPWVDGDRRRGGGWGRGGGGGGGGGGGMGGGWPAGGAPGVRKRFPATARAELPSGRARRIRRSRPSMDTTRCGSVFPR